MYALVPIFVAPGATVNKPFITVGIDTAVPGILLGTTMVAAFTNKLIQALSLHRLWDRAKMVMTSAGPAA